MHLKYKRILWDIESFLENKFPVCPSPPAPLPKGEGSFSRICNSVKGLEWEAPAFITRDGFYLTENIGNNSFDYFQGKKIWVPPVIQGDESNICLGDKVVFQDEGKESYGLQSYVSGKTGNTQTPIFVCDNHNYVLEAWDAFAQKSQNTLVLLHVDQHRDDAEFSGDLSDDYRRTTKICDYIDFALKKKWIEKDFFSFTESKDLEKFDVSCLDVNKNYILNIDLDFFAPELTAISLHEKLELIIHLLPHACLITLATSPLFIDQEFAIEISRLFWRYF